MMEVSNIVLEYDDRHCEGSSQACKPGRSHRGSQRGTGARQSNGQQQVAHVVLPAELREFRRCRWKLPSLRSASHSSRASPHHPATSARTERSNHTDSKSSGDCAWCAANLPRRAPRWHWTGHRQLDCSSDKCHEDYPANAAPMPPEPQSQRSVGTRGGGEGSHRKLWIRAHIRCTHAGIQSRNRVIFKGILPE